MLTGHGYGIRLVINRAETALSVKHGNAFFQHDTRDLAVLCADFLRPPATVNLNALILCLKNFFLRGGAWHRVAPGNTWIRSPPRSAQQCAPRR